MELEGRGIGEGKRRRKEKGEWLLSIDIVRFIN